MSSPPLNCKPLLFWFSRKWRYMNVGTFNRLTMDVQMIGFMTAPDAGTIDEISFTLPVMKEMGDQVHITTKELIQLS